MDEELKTIEEAKLAVERDRLRLDRDVFEADSNKRAVEVAKLEAEHEKACSEKVKVELESADLKRSWYKRPAFLTSLSLPVIIGTVLGAFLTYIGSLNTQRQQLEVEGLKLQKTSLEVQNSDAQNTLAKLRQEAADLTARNASAGKQYDDLLSKQSLLEKSNEALTIKASQLEVTAELGNLREYIELLKRDDPASLIASNKYVGDIAKEVSNDDRNLQKRDFLRHSADDSNERPEVRALLYLALFQSEKDSQYIRMIGRLANSADLRAFNTFGSLLKTVPFDLNDRAQFVCGEFHKLPPQSDQGPNRIKALEQLVRYDRDALVSCRDPFLDLIVRLRDSGGLSLLSLYDFSIEGLVITLAKSTLSGEEIARLLDDRIKMMSAFVPADALNALIGHPVSEPHGSPVIDRKVWIDQNQRLIAIWSEPNLDALRTARDEVFRKILSNRWVSIGELN